MRPKEDLIAHDAGFRVLILHLCNRLRPRRKEQINELGESVSLTGKFSHPPQGSCCAHLSRSVYGRKTVKQCSGHLGMT